MHFHPHFLSPRQEIYEQQSRTDPRGCCTVTSNAMIFSGQEAMADVACVNAQTVHFVRHGEGFHNIGIVNLDAHLTEAGWRQAEALNKHVAGLKPALDIQARPDR